MFGLPICYDMMNVDLVPRHLMIYLFSFEKEVRMHLGTLLSFK
jgi:hypothetical protein